MSSLNKTDGAILLPLRHVVLFPFVLTPVFVDKPEEVERLRRALAGNRLVATFPVVPENTREFAAQHPDKALKVDHYGEELVSAVGCKTRIVKMLNMPDGAVRVLLRGVARIGYVAPPAESDGTIFPVIPDPEEDSAKIDGMVRQAVQQFHMLAGMLPNFPEELRLGVINLGNPLRIVDMIADTLGFSYEEKICLLQLGTVEARLYFLLGLLNREIEVMQLGSKIQAEVHQNLTQNQREYYLREQLRLIKEELKEDSRNPDIADIETRMAALDLPEAVTDTVNKELSRLELIPTASPEYHVSYNYIDWLLAVPWKTVSDDNLDIKRAAQTLDADHYGLEDVKKRILEFLAVLALKPDRKSPILCLVGPPGVGKTSLGQSIARATNRKFVRVALGGVRDEAEIRGHRRTYIGALPGRIIQNLKKAGVANPVFMLDEIDKLASDQRGDPASALLEVLDPAQNNSFNDHYLELDYDLSRVFFIATANVLETIPPPLLDRMEIIRLPGYTNFEKREIARRYLAPRQIRENGLKSRQIYFSMAAIDEIIDYYTREAGVRHLEQSIAAVCRKLARKIVEGEIDAAGRTTVQPALVRECLGPRRYLIDEAAHAPAVGSATGMAWTAVGGEILTVESLILPGKGDLKLTGRLGEVMRESAEAAFSLLKSRAGGYGIAEDIFEKHNFHIHVPDGATPKDGPSAGITITAALYSLLTGRQTRPALAMTGEVNLRGQVTAIGGLKEKVIAALRSGIQTVVIPEENVKDLEEIPDMVRSKLEFKPVADVDTALAVIFGPGGQAI